MAKINLEKIYKELSKGTPTEMYDAFTDIKTFLSKELEEHRKKMDKETAEMVEKIQKINGN